MTRGTTEPVRTDGPTTLATPGWWRSASARRRSAATCVPAPGPIASTSVGARMPGAKPAEAAALARATDDEDGISPISGEPRPSPLAAQAAIPSPATQATTTSSATGRAVAKRASGVPAAAGLPGATCRKITPLSSPSRAGMSVSDTTMDTSTVAASPGPKARSRPPRATSSAPVPAATINPAASTIGADSAVESRTACRRSAPSASRLRIPERKNTQ